MVKKKLIRTRQYDIKKNPVLNLLESIWNCKRQDVVNKKLLGRNNTKRYGWLDERK